MGLSRGAVLVVDPIGGDASVIAAVLTDGGLSTITPAQSQKWGELAGEADGVIVNLAAIDAAALGKLTRCRVVARLGVGVDNIDVAAARARSIVVTNVPDYCREEVSDHALALMLAMTRKIPQANGDVQRGRWNQLHYRPIHRLNGLVLGLVGFGRLAYAVARKAGALGMRVLAADPYAAPDRASGVRLVPFDELLRESDVVSLHAPLSRETRGMIDAGALQKMKRGAILINTSRGELIDETALAGALDSGHLAGAALDVLATEPVREDSRLLGRSNVVLTPHIAFYSEESLIELQRTAAEDVVRVLAGEAPRYRVV